MVFLPLALQQSGTGSHIGIYPYISTNNRVIAHFNISQNSGIGVNYHVVADFWMPVNAFDGISVFIQRKTFCSQRYALIHFHIAANYGCFANNDPRSVINGKEITNNSSGMNVDTCFGMCLLGNDTGNDGNSKFEQGMSDAVTADSANARVTENNLAITFGCRITIKSRNYIGMKYFTYRGQLTYKIGGNLYGLCFERLTGIIYA